MAEFDEMVQYVNTKLTPIRDIVLHLHSILTWQKPYHAPSILVSVTSLYLIVWLVDIPILSKLSFFGIILTLLDYFLPFINALVAFPKWQETETKQFEKICTNITETWVHIRDLYLMFISWKETNTKLYYTTLLTTLMITSWISMHINNLMLIYLFTVFIVMYPGLSHHNMFEEIMQNLSKFISYLLNRPQTSPKKTK